MKNPKWREAYPQGHKVKYGGKFLTTWSGYSLDLIQTNGGTISAQRNRGYEDDEVPMSYTANQFYVFDGWSANEGSFVGNNYKFGTNDASAKASFKYEPIPQSAQKSAGGRIWTTDLAIDDGGDGIKKIDNPSYVYVSAGVSSVYNLPGPIYYYNYSAACRIANKLSGWRLPNSNDWDSINPDHNNHLRWKSSSETQYWPPKFRGTGGYDIGLIPYFDYDIMYKLTNRQYAFTMAPYWPSFIDVTATQYHVYMGEPDVTGGNSLWGGYYIWETQGIELGTGYCSRYANPSTFVPLRLVKE